METNIWTAFINGVRAFMTPGSGVWRKPVMPSKHAAGRTRKPTTAKSARPRSKAHYLRFSTPQGRKGK